MEMVRIESLSRDTLWINLIYFYIHLVYCVDAKIGFDDNASFRQKEIFDQRDTAEEDPREVEASKYNLNYVGMDGNIGCMGK